MKKTKIVCTMGPNANDEGLMRNLVKNGMNIARFNFSHGDYEEHKYRIDPGGGKDSGCDSSGYQGTGDPHRCIKRR